MFCFFFNALSASILYCSCLQNSIPFTSTENLTTLQQFELKLYLELTIRGCLNLTVEASEIYISFCFFLYFSQPGQTFFVTPYRQFVVSFSEFLIFTCSWRSLTAQRATVRDTHAANATGGKSVISKTFLKYHPHCLCGHLLKTNGIWGVWKPEAAIRWI